MRATLTIAAMVLGLGNAPSAFAQLNPGVGVGQIGSYNRPRVNPNPTISPYLNLTRPGNTAINYFGIVRPQQEAIRQFQQIDSQMMLDEQLAAQAFAGQPTVGPTFGRITGHPAGFFNYSHYYTFPGQRGSGGNFGTGGTFTPRMGQVGTPSYGARTNVLPQPVVNPNSGLR